MAGVRRGWVCGVCMVVVLLMCSTGRCLAQRAGYGERMTRLIWQDHETGGLYWGEVFQGQAWTVTASPVRDFPKLTAGEQSLVQMDRVDEFVLAGVRGNADGSSGSGWVALDIGVRGVPHGNHFDWQYPAAPRVLVSALNAEQGNPAHLYVSGGRFYVANDRKNGFTVVDPKRLGKEGLGAAQFFSGGGGHITMAPVENRRVFATWIDGGGPNQGRVDVVELPQPGGQVSNWSFQLPTGVLHGAATCAGKVFFAPADGVCWVPADVSAPQGEAAVPATHISLGQDAETGKPLRTGAFVCHRNYVVFVTGSGEQSALCLLDAAAAQPELIRIPLAVPDGLSLVTPEIVLAAGGKRYAFVFMDRAEGEVQEQLAIIDLDPDGNRNFADAKVRQMLPVGASRVSGHSGHHSVAFDSEGRIACIANPGDGTIWVMTLKDLQVRGKSKVGGQPQGILAAGSASHHH
ncbi:MAG: hypothetical protein ACK5KS_22805 [Planctomyces sp.]